MNIYNKLTLLKNNLKKFKNIVISFSGGVDSTFLLKIAHDILKENVLAITAKSSTFPKRELNEAISFTSKNKIQHIVFEFDELNIEGFSNNPPNRCYLCKRELFSKIITIANQENICHIADGSNFDDINDYRPGLIALNELSILSPLKENKLTKEEIRILSKELNLPTWDKPAFSCLSTRFPYGQKITLDKLQMIEKAEEFLFSLGFTQIRVRHHGDIARIEVSPNERNIFFDLDLMDKTHHFFKSLGFNYICLDLKGYRTGSMNDIIKF